MLNEMKSAFGENTAKKLAVGLAGALTLGTLLAGVVFATGSFDFPSCFCGTVLLEFSVMVA